MTPTYDPYLVILSVIVGVLAAFSTLFIARKVVSFTPRTAMVWVCGGGITMGTGIWTLHFVAMLALELEVRITYDLGLTVLSLVWPILACGAALWVLRFSAEPRGQRIAGSAGLIGIGIGSMHYTGMAAIDTVAQLHHEPLWVVGSLVVGLVGSWLALWLAREDLIPRSNDAAREDHPESGRVGAARESVVVPRVLAPPVLGCAVAGLHYTGMAGMVVGPAAGAEPDASIDRALLAALVIGATLVIMAVTLWAAAVQERRQTAATLADREQFLNHLVSNLPAMVFREVVHAPAEPRAGAGIDGALPGHPGMTFLSDGARDLTGFDAEELLAGKPCYRDLIHPEDRPGIHAVGEAGTGPYRIGYRLRRRDGRLRWVQEAGAVFQSPAVEADDAVALWREGLVEDMTERWRDTELIEGQRITLQRLTNGDSAASVLSALIARVEANAGPLRLIVFQFQRGAGTLACVAWHGLDPGVQEALNGGDVDGIPGVMDAMRRGRPETLMLDPVSDAEPWQRARRAGFDRVEIYPLQAEGARDGVLFCFSDGAVDPVLTELRAMVAGMSAMAIRREASEQTARLSIKALEGTAEGVLVTDPENRILWSNTAYRNLLDLHDHEVIGRLPAYMEPGAGVQPGDEPEPDHEVQEVIRERLADGVGWRGEVWLKRENAEAFPALLSVSPVLDAAGQLTECIHVVSDKSRFLEFERALSFISQFDTLTGLGNRSLLHHRASEAARAAQEEGTARSLLWIDIDGFKAVNHSLGPQAGDQLLRELGQRIERAAGAGDATVFRAGADEFAVLTGEGTPDELARLATDLLKHLADPVALNEGETFHASASIGISISPSDAGDGENLIANANSAMILAKHEGGGSYRFYAPEIHQQAYRHLRRSNQLREALEQEQFHLEYQPQFHAGSGSISGVEALIRWDAPGEGRVSPGEFIPMAEEIGLIEPIGRWALRAACAQAAAWLQEGLEVRVGVNLAPRQLLADDFEQDVLTALQDTGLPAHLLELEITEGSLIADPDLATRHLTAVTRHGVRVAVDDFGTGYSSLAYLKQFPLNCLKLDRTFVSGLPEDASDATIARTVIGMAGSLGMDMIAEGIETEAQWRFLADHGCESIQGFWACRPARPETLGQLLRTGLDRVPGR